MSNNGRDLNRAYNDLMKKSKELFILESASSIIYWDMETKMPPRGIQLRSQQMALLEKIGHRMITDPEIGKLLDKIQSHSKYDNLDQLQKRNVHLAKKEYDEATKLPEDLVVETARQRTVTVDIWKKAKAAKNWDIFKPDLEKLFELRKQAADILMDVKGTATRYDALIDIYEPRMSSDKISLVFTDMKEGLVNIMEKILNAPKQPDTSILRRKVPIETQRKIAETMAERIGYDVTSNQSGGRIDETEHPFTTGYFDDVRITTHYYEEQFGSSVFSVLHEGGHALYEQGLPHDWMFQPVGVGCSMGIHESQSRFVENMFGKSPEFWSYFFPKLNDMTGGLFSDVGLDEFILAINKVEPSKIRVEADEVTYGLHIIIRFEIEKALFAEEITINELPHVWNEKYLEYLGVTVTNDSEGVMQDTHWAGGSYGYFPSYALGNIYGGQMLEKMMMEIPNYQEKMAQGSFKEMGTWLTENVHKYGNLYDPAELIKVITGDSLRIEPFLDYLDDKYEKIYGY